MTDQNADLLISLEQEASQLSFGNFTASEVYARRAARLTILNLVSSILILFFVSNEGAVEIVSTLVRPIQDWIGYKVVDKTSTNKFANVLIATFGAVAVAAAALQYVLKYEERLMVHKYFGADYKNLSRKIRRLLAAGQFDNETVHMINRQFNHLSRHAPLISSHVLREPLWIRLRHLLKG